MNKEQAEAAVHGIMVDLVGRKGLSHQWVQIEREIREEILEEWVKIVLREASRNE